MRLLRSALFLNVVLSISLFSIGLVDQFEFPKYLFRLFVVALCFAVGASFCSVKDLASTAVVRARGLVRDPIGLGVGAFWVSTTLATLASLSLSVSFYGMLGNYAGWLSITSYAVLFFATREAFQDSADARHLLTALIVATVACAFYGAVQFFGFDPLAWNDALGTGRLLRPPSTAGHPNHASGALVCALPFVLYFLWETIRDRRWGGAAILGVVSSLSLFAIAVMRSRASWCACLASGLIAGALVFRLNKKALAVVALVVAAVAGGAMALHALGDLTVLKDRLPLLADFLDRFKDLLAPGAARTEYLRSGLRMFHAHPLLGVGPDLYEISFARERNPAYWLVEWQGVANRAHNELIELAATQGVVGLFAVLALIIGIGVVARAALSTDKRPYVIALVSSISAFLVQCLGSFSVSPTTTVFVTAAALLSNEWPGRRADVRSPDHGWFPLALAASLMATAWVYFHSFWPVKGPQAISASILLVSAPLAAFAVVFAATERRTAPRLAALKSCALATAFALAAGKLVLVPLEASVIAQYALELEQAAPRWALVQAEKAEQLDRSEPIYVTTVASQAEVVAGLQTDPKERRAFEDLEERAYEYAAYKIPVHPNYHYSHAMTLARRVAAGQAGPGDREKAVDELARTLELEPRNPIFLAGAASTEIMMGEVVRAYEHARAGVALYPDYSVFHYLAGHAAMSIGRYDIAVDQLREALIGKSFAETERWRKTIVFDPVILFTDSDRARARQELATAMVMRQKR